MLRRHRFFVALAVCISSLILMPVIPFATDVIGWEMFSAIYEIFEDGFESGVTSEWSKTVSGSKVIIDFPRGSLLLSEILSTADPYGHCLVPDVMLGITTADGKVLGYDCHFRISSERVSVTFSLEPVIGKPETPLP